MKEEQVASPSPETASQNESSAVLYELYMFFSMTMRYPEEEFFNKEFLDGFEHLLHGLELNRELETFQQFRHNDDNLLQTLRIEYTRLFINAVPSVPAPPYASVYMGGDHDLQGKFTEQTREFYRTYGYDIVDSSEPADHIAFELEFLAALVRDGEFEAEEEFVAQLFRPWFLKFQERLQGQTLHPYYEIAVQLIASFTDKSA